MAHGFSYRSQRKAPNNQNNYAPSARDVRSAAARFHGRYAKREKIMSLKNVDTVDVVVQSPHFDGYDLIAVDSGDIDNEVDRYNAMIDKLTSYMEYVVGGQLYLDTPESKEKTIRLCVLCKTKPNESMLKVQALRLRSNPSIKFDVLVATQDQYLK